MNNLKIEQNTFRNFFPTEVSKSGGTSFKSMLSEELAPEETFADMCTATFEKYFGQSAQNYFHIMDASSISPEIWTHNDFPCEKFLSGDVDESVLNWKPTRANPSQLDSDVQKRLTATLGKNAVIIPPELAEKLKTDSALRKKVIANIDEICKFHMQPPLFKMPGVKEYGTKIFGSVTILNAEGDVENCRITSGGTITGPDEETLRQIEQERKRKLKHKEFNAELLEQVRIEYLTARKEILTGLNAWN